MPSVYIKKIPLCAFSKFENVSLEIVPKSFKKTFKPTEIHVSFQIPICNFNETFSNSN